ncbi:CPCC family cysteine-rich protein [Phascolarctobacterium succinatutens]|uniref:CPCC family cysteine-rich protein n=2 Tax=Phascolarctobacterium succinatutens TaxID=626940 RepID=UPI003AB4D831
MKHLCPVCGQYEFTRRSANPLDGCYLGCKICGWIDDAVLELEPDFDGGELGISLNQARAEWAAKHKQ